jgi:hypothetical protein
MELLNDGCFRPLLRGSGAPKRNRQQRKSGGAIRQRHAHLISLNCLN